VNRGKEEDEEKGTNWNNFVKGSQYLSKPKKH